MSKCPDVVAFLLKNTTAFLFFAAPVCWNFLDEFNFSAVDEKLTFF